MAMEVDGVNKRLRVYCNGFLEKEVTVSSMSFSSIEKVSLPGTNVASLAADEFRLSKGLRYDGKLFLPPSQAYS